MLLPLTQDEGTTGPREDGQRNEDLSRCARDAQVVAAGGRGSGRSDTACVWVARDVPAHRLHARASRSRVASARDALARSMLCTGTINSASKTLSAYHLMREGGAWGEYSRFVKWYQEKLAGGAEGSPAVSRCSHYWWPCSVLVGVLGATGPRAQPKSRSARSSGGGSRPTSTLVGINLSARLEVLLAKCMEPKSMMRSLRSAEQPFILVRSR